MDQQPASFSSVWVSIKFCFLLQFQLLIKSYEPLDRRIILQLANIFSTALYSYVVLTTSGGIMDHEEARRKHLGGKILGFFF